MTEIFCNEDNRKSFDVPESADMQRVLIPALLQLDLPLAWDKTQVFDYIDEMRLKGTSDMNIRVKAILREDFTILADIVNTVLYDFNELRVEINQLMSDMLPNASIDTSKPAEMGVNISVLDKEESVPFKSSFKFDVKLRQTFQLIQKSLIRGCIIINDQLVFTDYYHKSLRIYDINGSYIAKIILSESPQFISVINDNDIAVSYDRDFIEIIDINTRQVKNTIVTRGFSGGISYQNGLMYVVINCQKIEKINLTGDIVRFFQCPLASRIRCLSTDTDRLFLNDPLNDTLYCCDLSGSVKWKFIDDKMIMPGRVTLDGNGNIYVSCYSSNNVVVVSPDGKHHKELLTEEDGLLCPSSIYYDKLNDCLLVCNGGNCDAFLFDVKHSPENERMSF